MDIRKLIPSILASPLIVEYAPYVPLLKAVTILVIGDIVLGLLAATLEKYKTLHPAAILKTFKSRKLLPKFGIGLLFFAGLFFIHTSDPLLIKLGIGETEAGQYFCVAYGLYELTSILENLGRLNFPIAKQIKNWINSKLPEELKEKKDDNPS